MDLKVIEIRYTTEIAKRFQHNRQVKVKLNYSAELMQKFSLVNMMGVGKGPSGFLYMTLIK